MALQESGQMYLETILILTGRNANVRSVDICDYMSFSKPSVSRAVGILKKGGYINVSPDGYITLTDKGESEAKRMYDRHRVLSTFLVSLGVPEDIASADACKIEHHVSDTSFDAIKRHIEKNK